MERRITIEESVLYKEDYQMRMLTCNPIEGLLPVKGRGMNGNSFYDYDVSGKVSIKAMYQRSKMNSKDIKTFLVRLRRVIESVENHLLNKHCILLKPEYIFYEKGQYYFCYYPLADTDFWEEFHALTEYFVKKTDYEDKDCVKITFLLHKETMEENYSLDKLVEECLKIEEKVIEKTEIMEPDIPPISYDTTDHDWIHNQDRVSSILKETDNMWAPVKRFLHKHKKTKWGSWDGLYVEEEDL